MATAVLLIFLFPSCEKIITVKLDEAPSRIVIEGMVSNQRDSAVRVKISETKKFEEDNSFKGVSGAVVTITVNNGRSYNLSETASGIYETSAFTGATGTDYELSVLLNGIIYTASSTMPSPTVLLDSIWAETLTFAGSSLITIYPSYVDPLGESNSYRLVEYKNGGQIKYVFAQNDDFSDGLIITRPLINPDGDLASGDTVRVDLQCIDAAVYKYWFSLDQAATGQNQSATPTNPISNIKGDALGYFSAYSVTSQTIAIP